MLGRALEYRSHYDYFYRLPGKGRAKKTEALQSYKQAATPGRGGTKDAAQKAMQSNWFHDVAKTIP